MPPTFCCSSTLNILLTVALTALLGCPDSDTVVGPVNPHGHDIELKMQATVHVGDTDASADVTVGFIGESKVLDETVETTLIWDCQIPATQVIAYPTSPSLPRPRMSSVGTGSGLAVIDVENGIGKTKLTGLPLPSAANYLPIECLVSAEARPLIEISDDDQENKERITLSDGTRFTIGLDLTATVTQATSGDVLEYAVTKESNSINETVSLAILCETGASLILLSTDKDNVSYAPNKEKLTAVASESNGQIFLLTENTDNRCRIGATLAKDETQYFGASRTFIVESGVLNPFLSLGTDGQITPLATTTFTGKIWLFSFDTQEENKTSNLNGYLATPMEGINTATKLKSSADIGASELSELATGRYLVFTEVKEKITVFAMDVPE